MATHSSIFAWENSMDRGAWRATIHGIAELDTTEATYHACAGARTHTHTSSYCESGRLCSNCITM